jgi:hypothetical protein
VPGPRWILSMSFGPANQQHRRDLLCSGAILSNTGRNSGERDDLVLHSLRLSAGPSLGRTRRSLASTLAITQSLR